MGRSEKRTKTKPQKMRRAISSLAWGIQKNLQNIEDLICWMRVDVWINLTLNILYTVHPFDELCVKCDLFGGGGGKKSVAFSIPFHMIY